MSKLFSGQGKILLASTVGGVAGVFREVGNAMLKIALSSDVSKHTEHQTGNRLEDGRLTKTKGMEFTLTLDEWTKENLALGLYSAAATITGSTVTAEAFPATVAVDDLIRLAHPKVSSVVVKDSAGTPATLVADTDYSIFSADHGTIKMLSLGAYTQPFTADYTYGDVVNIPLFTQAAPERWLRFEGINTGDGNNKVLLELYRAYFDPIKNLDAISDDYAPLEMTGSVLYDSTKELDTVLGQFGRFMDLA